MKEETPKKINKNDFIEIDFIGKLNDGGVFDSNIESELERINPNSQSIKSQSKPFIFSVGNDMFLRGIDEFLEGKEIGTYEIPLSPEKSFGKRKSELIRRIPSKLFKEQKLNPFPGATFNFDGQIGKVLSVSGGRILVDFNNPLSGKDVVYTVIIKRKVEDIKEKVSALLEFLFKQEFEFEIDNSNKKVILKLKEKQKPLEKFISIFNQKFKDILGLDLTISDKKN